MSRRFLQFRVLSVVAALALASAVCGASPQEESKRGNTPQPRPQSPGPTSYNTNTQPNRKAGERPFVPGGPRATPHEIRRPSTRETLSSVTLQPGTRLVNPPAWKHRRTIPDMTYWGSRDLFAEIQWLSRRGFIPVSPLGDGVETLTDFSQQPAGWRAYGIAVPPGGILQVEVQHEKLGWFRLMMVNKWGNPGAGMLHAANALHPVMVTSTNPGSEATAVYIIVDDPGRWSDEKAPYTLLLRRKWDPSVDLSEVKVAEGLWGASPSVSAQYRRPSMSGPAVYPR